MQVRAELAQQPADEQMSRAVQFAAVLRHQLEMEGAAGLEIGAAIGSEQGVEAADRFEAVSLVDPPVPVDGGSLTDPGDGDSPHNLTPRGHPSAVRLIFLSVILASGERYPSIVLLPLPGAQPVTTPIRTETRFFTSDEPIALDAGSSLPGFTLAYEQYGELNEARDNAILVFHALTGSQHAAGFTESVAGVGERWTAECQTGWWDAFIGPGRALDTDRFAVFCVNYLGGCYGSTGPSSENPETGTPYGGSFPAVSVDDIVDSQLRLLDHLGVEQLHAVTGASMGALMCLSLAIRFPDRVDLVIPIAGGLEVTALQFIHNFEQINAIVNDPSFQGGDYYAGPRPGPGPGAGSHDRSQDVRVAGRHGGTGPRRDRRPERGIRLHPHQPSHRVLPLAPGAEVRAVASTPTATSGSWRPGKAFDLRSSVGAATYEEALRACKDQVFMVFSIDSDVCFYPEEQERMMQALKAAGVPARRITVHSEKGHDSFLLEPSLFAPHLRQTLEQPWGVD